VPCSPDRPRDVAGCNLVVGDALDWHMASDEIFATSTVWLDGWYEPSSRDESFTWLFPSVHATFQIS